MNSGADVRIPALILPYGDVISNYFGGLVSL